MTPRDLYEENQRKLGNELLAIIAEHGLINVLWQLASKVVYIAQNSYDKEYSGRLYLISVHIGNARDAYVNYDPVGKPPLTEEEINLRIKFQNNIRKRMHGESTPEIDKSISDYIELINDKKSAR